MSFSLQSQKLLRLFNSQEISNDNLHLIAISNLSDPDRRIERWWCKKYGQPMRPYLEHTREELMIEFLEDYYENNPNEIGKIMMKINDEPDWDGQMSADHEVQMQKILKKKKQVDLSGFKSDEEISPDVEEEILRNLGRNLPPRKVVHKTEEGVKVIGDEEFEEKFGDTE